MSLHVHYHPARVIDLSKARDVDLPTDLADLKVLRAQLQERMKKDPSPQTQKRLTDCERAIQNVIAAQRGFKDATVEERFKEMAIAAARKGLDDTWIRSFLSANGAPTGTAAHAAAMEAAKAARGSKDSFDPKEHGTTPGGGIAALVMHHAAGETTEERMRSLLEKWDLSPKDIRDYLNLFKRHRKQKPRDAKARDISVPNYMKERAAKMKPAPTPAQLEHYAKYLRWETPELAKAWETVKETKDTLKSGGSSATISKNIKTEVKAGKPQAQAVAIALHQAKDATTTWKWRITAKNYSKKPLEKVSLEGETKLDGGDGYRNRDIVANQASRQLEAKYRGQELDEFDFKVLSVNGGKWNPEGSRLARDSLYTTVSPDGAQHVNTYWESFASIITVAELSRIKKLKVGESIDLPRDWGTKKFTITGTRDALNHLNEREYQTYAAWRAAAKAKGATEWDGDKDIATAFKRVAGERVAVGEWYGDKGSIYKTAVDAAGPLQFHSLVEYLSPRSKNWQQYPMALSGTAITSEETFKAQVMKIMGNLGATRVKFGPITQKREG